MGNVAALRLQSRASAEWAAKFVGEYEYWEMSYGKTEGREESYTHNRNLKERPSILPAEFRDFPLTNPQNGMHGFFACPAVGVWRGPIAWPFIANHIHDPAPGDPGVKKRGVADYRPVPWTAEDLRRLGLAGTPPRTFGTNSGLRTMDDGRAAKPQAQSGASEICETKTLGFLWSVSGSGGIRASRGVAFSYPFHVRPQSAGEGRRWKGTKTLEQHLSWGTG